MILRFERMFKTNIKRKLVLSKDENLNIQNRMLIGR
jgi:hypothetical protein